VNLAALEAAYKVGETVSPASLVARGLVRREKGRAPEVKILGTGTLTKALVIRGCTLSAAALSAVQAAGGTSHD
jgi:large subunit ribosomal protein L15